MKTHFDADWKNWIKSNVSAGRDRDGIFKILLDEGYEYAAIKKEMNYEPSIPAQLLVNPFHAQKQAQQQTQQQANAGAKIDPRQLFIPNAKKLDSDKIELYTLDNFLNEEECKKIVSLIKTKMKPSTLSSHEPDQYFRTSSTCYLGEMDNDFMCEIDERICKILGVDKSYGETIQGQHYEVGQEFKAHTDYFEAHEIHIHGAKMGQRTYTFMIYLNDVEEGGETDFTELGISFKPKIGTAVIWNSLNPDGTTNGYTMHHAKPVTKGTKTIITKWFRSKSALPSAPPMHIKEENEYIPNYTHKGFAKYRLPDELFKEIQTFYNANKGQERDEHVPGGFVYSEKDKSQVSSFMVDLSPALREKIHDAMKPALEEWCGEELDPTFVYGIRVYRDGAVLVTHRDRLETHIISTIINVDQEVDEDWPLIIDDNSYREHHVMLSPGDAVFYEGGRLRHGRPIAFKGKSFANIFCHFKPKTYIPKKL